MSEIKQAIEEYEKFQETLDDLDKELTLKDIRSILGHVVFGLRELIEQFVEVRMKILSILPNKTEEKTIENLNENKDLKFLYL